MSITITAQNDATATLQEVRTEATSIGELRPTVTVGAEDNTTSTFSEVRSGATEIGALRPTVTVGAEDNTSATFSSVRGEATEIGALRPTVTVGAENNTTSEFTAVRGEATAIGALRPTVMVEAENNATSEFAAVTAEATAVGRLRPTVTVDADTAGAEAKLGALIATEGLAAAASGVLSAALTGIGFGVVAAGAITLVAAIGPLVAILAIAAAGVGFLAAGIAALAAPFAIWAANSAAATKEAKDNETQMKAVEAATTSLNSAYDQAAQAQQRVATATDQASKANATALKQYQDAVKGVGEAEIKLQDARKRLNDSTTELRRAQDDLNRAFLTENERVARLELDLTSQRINAKQATLDLAKAQDDLNKARAEGDKMKIAQAELDVQRAQVGTKTSTLDVQDAQTKLNDARTKGTTELQSSEQKFKQAYDSQQQAVEGVRKAQDGLTSAIQKVGEMAKNAADTQKRGAEQVAAAEDQVRQANDRVTDAITKLTEAQEKSNEETGVMEKLWEQFGPTVTAAFAPAITQAKLFAADLTGIGSSILPALGRASAGVLQGVRQGFESVIARITPSEQNSFGGILARLPGFMTAIATAAGDFTVGFLSFLDAAGPQVISLGQWIADIAKRFREWMDSQEGRDKIKEWFDAAVPVAQELWKVLTDIVPKLVDLGINYGPTVVTFLEDASRAAQWLVDVFNDMKPLIDGIVTLLGNLGTALDNTSTKSGADTETIRAGWKTVFDDLHLGTQNAADHDLSNLGQAFKDTSLTSGATTSEIQSDWAIMAGELAMTMLGINTSQIDSWNLLYDALVGNSIVPDMTNAIVSEFQGMSAETADHMQGYYSDTTAKFAATTDDARVSLEALTAQVIHTFGDEPGEVAGWARGQMAKYQESVTQAFIQTTQNATVALTNFTQAVINAISATVNAAASFQDDFQVIGGNYIVGLQNGMVSKTGDLYAAVQRIGQNVVTTMKSSLGVRSPSTEGYYAGEMLGLGLENALYDKVTPVGLAAEALARAAIEPLSRIDTTSLVLGADLDGTPGAALWRAGEVSTGLLGSAIPTALPVAPGASGTSGGDAGVALAIVGEIRALRQDNEHYAGRHEELMSLLAGAVDEMSPRLRREILDMAKNDPQFRQNNIKGQQSELEKKLFTGV